MWKKQKTREKFCINFHLFNMHNLATTMAAVETQHWRKRKNNQLNSCMQQTVDLILYRHRETFSPPEVFSVSDKEKRA